MLGRSPKNNMPLFTKNVIQVDDEELMTAFSEFMGCFEVVFRHDWDYTKIMIGDEEDGCNFLDPGLEDEVEDWGARGALLESYRHLSTLMHDRKMKPKFSTPIANFLGIRPTQ